MYDSNDNLSEINRKRKSIPLKKKNIIKVALIFLLPVFLEIFVCNFRYWQSMNYSPIEIILDENRDHDESFDAVYENLYGCGIVIKNIGFVFENLYYTGAIEVVTESIYSRYLPAVITYESIDEKDSYHKLDRTFPHDNSTGMQILQVHEISPAKEIKLTCNDAFFTRIIINAHVPFRLSIGRIVLMSIIAVLIFAFVYSDHLYSIKVFGNDKCVSKSINIIAFTSALIFFGLIMLMNENPMYSEIDDIYGFYPSLARAFAAGHCYELDGPSADVLNYNNPQDASGMELNGIDFKLDRALYNGRYYVYFGVLPCLVFHLPYYLITGKDISISPIIIVLVLFFLIAVNLMLIELFRRYKKDGSLAIYLYSLIMIILVMPLTCMAGGDTFPYYMPILMGIDLYMLGLYFYLRAVQRIDNKSNGNAYLALGSLCIALIAACRPSLLIVVITIIPLLIRYAVFKKCEIKRWLAFIIPVIAVAIPVMLYNYVRFDNPFDFGVFYQITIDGPQKHPSLISIISAFWHYLFRGVYPVKNFPFLSLVTTEWSNVEDIFTGTVFGGIFIFFPFLFLCLLSFVPCKKYRFNSETLHMSRLLIIAAGISLTTGSLVGGFFTRYRMDFSLLFGMSAILMFWNITDNPRKIVKVLLGILLIYSIYMSFIQFFSIDLIPTEEKSDFIYRCAEFFEFWN